ncbi:hypothetical protein NEOLI_003382 [Neolecta irregularis DAH-3]|uniref:Uncharacterized protein n=1 Tax=Neolecta irregularis (strain DAH-3) TaxID=1198029 RepID=A0A1U7LUB9_NEOID|nr:hypothetical protein NEOLI_003382 [Neolecta irregularis DAH-3]|eukprot:OLL26219.1 hypothetical protein NEOLI_003382 [Neolecta irregularis DAH-3]
MKSSLLNLLKSTVFSSPVAVAVNGGDGGHWLRDRRFLGINVDLDIDVDLYLKNLIEAKVALYLGKCGCVKHYWNQRPQAGIELEIHEQLILEIAADIKACVVADGKVLDAKVDISASVSAQVDLAVLAL